MAEAAIKLEPEKPICVICLEEPFLPVRYTVHGINKEGKLVYKFCPAGKRSFCCLTCIRAYCSTFEGYVIKCPWRCCEGIKPSKPYLMYGEPNRKPEDYAEKFLWDSLDAYGVFNKKCNRCDHMCASMEEARDHPRKACPKRKIPCSGCQTLVMFEDIENHRLECLFASFRLL